MYRPCRGGTDGGGEGKDGNVVGYVCLCATEGRAGKGGEREGGGHVLSAPGRVGICWRAASTQAGGVNGVVRPARIGGQEGLMAANGRNGRPLKSRTIAVYSHRDRTLGPLLSN